MDEKHNSQTPAVIVLALLLCIAVGAIGFMLGQKKGVSQLPNPSPSSSPSTNSYENYSQVYGFQAKTGYVISGSQYLKPDNCSAITISADNDKDCYILIHYEKYINFESTAPVSPDNSADTLLDRIMGDESIPNGYCSEGNFSFYVCAGDTTTVNVPLGMATVYYASGNGWAGQELLFGPNTKRYNAGTTYDFSTHTYELTLHSVENGNLRPMEIDPESFGQ